MITLQRTGPHTIRVERAPDHGAHHAIGEVMQARPRDWASHPDTPSGDMAKIAMEYRDVTDAFQRLKDGEIHHAEFLEHLKNLCAAACCAYEKMSGDKAK